MKTRIGGIDVGSPSTRSALQYSLADGILWQIMFALVDGFAVAAALALKAPPIAISLLGSLPGLVGSFSQVVALGAVRPDVPRKSYVVAGVRFQVVFILAAALSGLLPPSIAMWAFVLSIALYGVSGMLFAPLWTTWFADLVPDAVMGRHMAWRNLYFSGTQMVVSLLVGWISRRYTTETAPWVFFMACMSVAAMVRFASSMALQRQYEPPRSKPYVPVTFRDFRPTRDLLVFTAAMSLLNGAAGMSGPYFGVWWLNDLHFNYLTYTIVGLAGTVGNLVSLRVWGKLADRIGATRALRIATLMAAVVPLPYLFVWTPEACVAWSFFAGLAWSGVNICGFKTTIRIASSGNAEQSLAFLNCVQGLSGFLFGLLGAWCATHLPVLFSYRLQSLFLLSGFLRLLVHLLLIARIPETGREALREVSLVQLLIARLESLLGLGKQSS